MTTYKQAEIKERILAAKLFSLMQIYDYKFSPQGSFSRTDGIYTLNGTTHIFEVKVRNHSIEKYPDYILEYDKLEGLKKINERYFSGEAVIDYIMFFKEPDDTYSVILFDVSEKIAIWQKRGLSQSDVWFMKRLPASTVSSRGWSWKEITYLSYNKMFDKKFSGIINQLNKSTK